MKLRISVHKEDVQRKQNRTVPIIPIILTLLLLGSLLGEVDGKEIEGGIEIKIGDETATITGAQLDLLLKSKWWAETLRRRIMPELAKESEETLKELNNVSPKDLLGVVLKYIDLKELTGVIEQLEKEEKTAAIGKAAEKKKKELRKKQGNVLYAFAKPVTVTNRGGVKLFEYKKPEDKPLVSRGKQLDQILNNQGATVATITVNDKFSFGDVISLKSGGEIEGKVNRYEDNKFVVLLSSGGKMSFSSKQVQEIVFSEVSSKTVVSWDSLTLRKSDGSTYVLKGRIKSYEDNKFTVVSSSGEQTAFSMGQIQSITFAEEREKMP